MERKALTDIAPGTKGTGRQGRQEPQDEGPVTITLSALVPLAHLLRRIDIVLDLHFIYELTKAL